MATKVAFKAAWRKHRHGAVAKAPFVTKSVVVGVVSTSTGTTHRLRDAEHTMCHRPVNPSWNPVATNTLCKVCFR